jgi:SsrA-binding protein
MATYADNKKAHFDYEFLEKFEGGLSLSGQEVKSIKAKQADLSGAYVVVRGGEVFLINATVSPYQVKNMKDTYDPDRPRKVLVSKKEIERLAKEEAKKGLTIVPISLYNKGNRIKLSFAVARGKKQFDKRQTIKKRDTDREIQRTLKNRR